MIETQKIEQNISHFLEAFKRLSGDEKIYFLAEIDKVLRNKSEKEKNLFLSLIKSAREGNTHNEAIIGLRKV